nr:MAG: capsid protein [Cressdnaviricota sp.]
MPLRNVRRRRRRSKRGRVSRPMRRSRPVRRSTRRKRVGRFRRRGMKPSRAQVAAQLALASCPPQFVQYQSVNQYQAPAVVANTGINQNWFLAPYNDATSTQINNYGGTRSIQQYLRIFQLVIENGWLGANSIGGNIALTFYLKSLIVRHCIVSQSVGYCYLQIYRVKCRHMIPLANTLPLTTLVNGWIQCNTGTLLSSTSSVPKTFSPYQSSEFCQHYKILHRRTVKMLPGQQFTLTLKDTVVRPIRLAKYLDTASTTVNPNSPPTLLYSMEAGNQFYLFAVRGTLANDVSTHTQIENSRPYVTISTDVKAEYAYVAPFNQNITVDTSTGFTVGTGANAAEVNPVSGTPVNDANVA